MTQEAIYDEDDNVHFVPSHPVALTVERFWEEVTERVLNHDERWGQAMFNVLAAYAIEGTEVCRGSLWDPFYRIKSVHTARTWFGGYVVIDSSNTITDVRDQY